MEALENEFSHIASLVGDKSRALMLWNLLDGRAYTATELAVCANISTQAASNHLAKLKTANILVVEKQGRHRYFRFANENVAQAIETMASLIVTPNDKLKKEVLAITSGVKYARTCYDHTAGKLGVAIITALINTDILTINAKTYQVSTKGKEWFASNGIKVEELQKQKRSFAHQCLDWSERKHHLAGALGAALLSEMLKKDWLRKVKNSRELIITTKGKTAFKTQLNIDI